VTLVVPQRASADWLFTPFLGTTFGGESPFLDLERATGTAQTIFGGSVAIQSDKIFGLEADFGTAPRFFERSSAGLVTSSDLTTLTGNVLAALPLSITRESLRPYVVAGAGWMHVGIADRAGFGSVDSTIAAIDVGGGAIGMLSTRAGVRFDLRHFRSLSALDKVLQPTQQAHQSFWRLSFGVTLRY
jgi:hypothetical protein